MDPFEGEGKDPNLYTLRSATLILGRCLAYAMEPIFDGNSEHTAHARRKSVFFIALDLNNCLQQIR